MAQIVEKIDWSKNATSVKLKVKTGGFLDPAQYHFIGVISQHKNLDMQEVVNQVFLNKKYWSENKKSPGSYILNITYGQSRCYITNTTKDGNLKEWATAASKKGAQNAKINRAAKKAAAAEKQEIPTPITEPVNNPPA